MNTEVQNPTELFTPEDLLTHYVGRRDVVGVRYESGWKCLRPQAGQFQAMIEDHSAGRNQVAIYPVLDDGTVWFATIDIDAHDDVDEDMIAVCHVLAFRIVDRLRANAINSYVSVSKSGGGNRHIDTFFIAPVSAKAVRRVLVSVVEAELAQLESEGKRKPSIEIIPKQDTLQPGSVGSSISLPHFPPCVSQGTTLFIDNTWNTFKPVIEKNDPEIIARLVSILPRSTDQSSPEAESLLAAASGRQATQPVDKDHRAPEDQTHKRRLSVGHSHELERHYSQPLCRKGKSNRRLRVYSKGIMTGNRNPST